MKITSHRNKNKDIGRGDERASPRSNKGNKRPKAIDLFCGAGGMSLGFEQAGFDIVLAVDRDRHHVATHDRNFPYGKTICASVVDLTGKELKKIAGVTEIDLVFGGPPCQGFSSMGKRDTFDPRNSLVGHFVRLIREIKPKAFVMENVPGMQQGDTRPFFDHVVQSLANAGYAVTLPARTLWASDFGAPQKRERLFILGVKKDLNVKVEYPERKLKDQVSAENVEEAIQGLPDIDGDNRLFSEDAISFKPRGREVSSRYSRVLCGIERDPTDFSYQRESVSAKLFGNKRTRHSDSSVALYRATTPGQMVPGHKLPRLNMKGVAPTLRAGTESERGSHTAPRPIHPKRPRCITVREAARLHGYPDWFAFYPAIHHGFRQVGNSVSPFVARNVGYKIAEALGFSHMFMVPETVIALNDEFVLPSSGTPAERRISHIDEFPKVLGFLFDQRFDRQAGNLTRSSFTHEDVRKAIAATGANMPRIRPERFIAEFAKTRNAKQIIAQLLRHGYSLKETETGGEFVPEGVPGSIGASGYVKFNSAEIKGATPIDLSAKSCKSDIDRAFNVIAASPAKNSIGRITREQDLLSDSQKKKQDFVSTINGKIKRGYFLIANGKAGVKYDDLAAQARVRRAELVVMAAQLTRRHLGLVVCSMKNNLFREIHKGVYLLSD